MALTRVYTRAATLARVAELTTHRRRWVLADSAGRCLAELVDDHVRVRAMGAQTTTVTWREVEVELGAAHQPSCTSRANVTTKYDHPTSEALPRTAERGG